MGASILLGIILPSPHFFHRSSHFNPFSKRSTQIFHCFPIVFPFLPHCFKSYSLIFSIVFLITFPSIAISPSPARRADQGGIDTPPSPNCHLVHNPKKVYPRPRSGRSAPRPPKLALFAKITSPLRLAYRHPWKSELNTAGLVQLHGTHRLRRSQKRRDLDQKSYW